ncbi:MAG: hypothetical protein V4592_19605 [Bacteroidota bacterium]
MKNILTLIALVLITAVTAKAQTGWVDYKADNHISVKFPSKPAEIQPGTVGIVTADSVTCRIGVIDIQKIAGVDSATLASMKENPEFIEQMRAGMQKNAKGTEIQPFKLGTWKGLTSYTSTGTGTNNMHYKIFIVVYGTTIYNLSAKTPAKADAKIGDSFFESLVFSK